MEPVGATCPCSFLDASIPTKSRATTACVGSTAQDFLGRLISRGLIWPGTAHEVLSPNWAVRNGSIRGHVEGKGLLSAPGCSVAIKSENFLECRRSLAYGARHPRGRPGPSATPWLRLWVDGEEHA